MPGVWRVPSISYAPPNYLLKATYLRNLGIPNFITPTALSNPAVLYSPKIYKEIVSQSISDPDVLYQPKVWDLPVLVREADWESTTIDSVAISLVNPANDGDFFIVVALSMNAGNASIEHVVVNGRWITSTEAEDLTGFVSSVRYEVWSFPLEANDEFLQIQLNNDSATYIGISYLLIQDASHARPLSISAQSISVGNPVLVPSWVAEEIGVSIVAWASSGNEDTQPDFKSQYHVIQNLMGATVEWQSAWKMFIPGTQAAENPHSTVLAVDNASLVVQFPLYYYAKFIPSGSIYGRKGAVVEVSPGPAEPLFEYAQEPPDQLPLPPDPEEIVVPLEPWLDNIVGPYRRSE